MRELGTHPAARLVAGLAAGAAVGLTVAAGCLPAAGAAAVPRATATAAVRTTTPFPPTSTRLADPTAPGEPTIGPPTGLASPTPDSGTDTPTTPDEPTQTGPPTDTPQPTDTASPPPSTDTTGSPAPDGSTATPTATGQASPTISPSPGDSGDASPSPTGGSGSGQRPASPPAVQTSDISLLTGLIAAATLLAAGLVLWLVQRAEARERRVAPAAAGRAAGAAAAPAVPAGAASLLVAVGEAMIDSGYPVAQVQTSLHGVARAQNAAGTEVIVLPTALFVTVPGEGRVETAVAAAGLSRLRLDQVDVVSRIVTRAERGELGVTDGLAALQRARAKPPPFGPAARTGGYALLSVGLAMVLQASVMDLVVAAVLGAAVGVLHLAVARLPAAFQAILPVLAAFAVSVVVFVLARTGADVGILAPLVAPLVTFLPGALLTTGVLELSTGQMISGAGRLAAGAMQLVLLALGIVAGGQLVGVPATTVGAVADQPLTDVAPWLGVALFGVGVAVHHCAQPSSIGWILLVLYVAYGAQVLGGLFFGAVLSAFIGALVMTPVAGVVAHRPTGPPTQVSFLPAFWLLVPGALGLVGVTQLLGADRVDAVTSLVTTGTTMIGIAFGVLLGLAAGSLVSRQPAT